MVVSSAKTSTTVRVLTRLEPLAWGVLGLVLVVIGWWIVVGLEWIPRSGLPGPGSVASAVSELVRDSEFRSAYFDTLYSWAKSLVYASLIGVAVGVVVGWFPLLSRAFTLPMHLFRSVPSTTLIPIAIVLFGLGSMMKVVIVTFSMSWLIVVNTIYGVQGVDRMTVLAARSMRFSQRDTFRLVLLPSAAPTILTGIRVAAGVGFVVTLGAELLGATTGVGTVMLSYQNAERPNFVYAGVLLVSFTGMLINFGMQAAERRITPWATWTQTMTVSTEAAGSLDQQDSSPKGNRATSSSARRRSPLRVLILGFSYFWLLALLLGVWEWRSRTYPSLFIPSPSDTLSRMRSVWFSGPPSHLFLSHDFHKHGWSSIRRWMIGFGLASFIGVASGALLASFRRLNWMFQPLIRLGQSTPSIMLIPLAIVLLGINDKMTVSVIVYGSVWPVLINTIDGIANIDPLTINSARALRLRRFSMLRLVTLRAASPQILAGLRVALGVSIILIVASELYASSSGIGYYITYSQRSLRFKDMFAGIGLAALIGIAANGLFYLVERRLLRWRPDNRGGKS